jgi:sensor c-di-GMP phosphodiesterase-like protein
MLRPQVYDHLAQRPTTFGLIGGLLSAGIVLVIASVLTLHAQVRDIEHKQLLASQRLEAVVNELNLSFQTLNQQIGQDCSPAALNQLRQKLLNQQFIRAYGVLNAQNQLACLSTEGLLTSPRALPKPDLHTTTQRSWYQYAIHPNKPAMNLIVDGHIAAFIDINLSNEIAQAGNIGVLWLGHDQNAPQSAQLVWSTKPALGEPLQGPARPELRFLDNRQPWLDIDWARQQIVVGTNVPHSAYLMQNKFSAWDVLFQSPSITLAVGLLALLLGALISFFIQHKLTRLNSLAFRIQKLCQPEHILCMYQPIIDLRSGQIIGCEVLMRIRDQDQIIFPDQLIPLIREQRLDWALDHAVSRKAIAELLQHLPSDTLQPFKVALNFFPENISHPALPALLQSLKHPRLALNIEVTEYGMSEALFDDVQALRADGYLISVDDFGTGYSNLATVKKLAPDFLKIDRSFVFDMEDNSLRSSLIPEIVGIATAVHAEVIAEGVENESQAQRLAQMGVQFAQGYWYGKPQTIANLIETLNNWPQKTSHTL